MSAGLGLGEGVELSQDGAADGEGESSAGAGEGDGEGVADGHGDGVAEPEGVPTMPTSGCGLGGSVTEVGTGRVAPRVGPGVRETDGVDAAEFVESEEEAAPARSAPPGDSTARRRLTADCASGLTAFLPSGLTVRKLARMSTAPRTTVRSKPNCCLDTLHLKPSVNPRPIQTATRRASRATQAARSLSATWTELVPLTSIDRCLRPMTRGDERSYAEPPLSRPSCQTQPYLSRWRGVFQDRDAESGGAGYQLR